MKKRKKLLLICLFTTAVLLMSGLFFNIEKKDKQPEVSKITFTVAGKAYEVLSGTTWRDYVAKNVVVSENPDEYLKDKGDYICFSSDNYLYVDFTNGVRVKPTDEIQGMEYEYGSFLCTMTIAGQLLTYERGMSWNDFVASDYNTLGLTLDMSKATAVSFGNDVCLRDINGLVFGYDKIVQNRVYTKR